MHYVDEGEATPVLLLHGEPTWSYLYRKASPRCGGRPRRRAGLLRLRPLGQAAAASGATDDPTRARSQASSKSWISATPPSSSRTGAGRSGCASRSAARPCRPARVMNTGIVAAGRRRTSGCASATACAASARSSARPADPALRGHRCAGRRRRGLQAPCRSPSRSRGSSRSPSWSRPRPTIRPRRRTRGARALAGGRAGARPLLRLRSDLLSPRGRALRRADPGRAEPEIVEGAGHFLQEDQGEKLGGRIARFVAMRWLFILFESRFAPRSARSRVRVPAAPAPGSVGNQEGDL